MAKWGMQNAKLESWGPFGRGWALKSFYAKVVEPQTFPVIAFSKAWSPSTNGQITADIVHFDVKSDTDYDKFKGQLKGKVVFVSDLREIKAAFEPMGERHTDEDLSKMASPPVTAALAAPRPQNNPQTMLANSQASSKRANFLIQEGAAVIVDSSSRGSGGTRFVSGATVAQPVPEKIEDLFGERRLSPYQKESESKMVPQMTMAEDYNRIIRMIRQGVKPKMTVDIKGQYYDDDLVGYNTFAEIPGTDPTLK